MNNITNSLHKHISFLSKFLVNNNQLLYNKITYFINFDFKRNSNINQIESHYAQLKIYINNFLNYLQSSNIIVIKGNEVLYLCSNVKKNTIKIIKLLNIILDSIKSLYQPLEVFNKYQLLGNSSTNNIKSISDIIDFIKLNENGIKKNYDLLSKNIKNSTPENDTVYGNGLPVIALKAARFIPFNFIKKNDDEYDDDEYDDEYDGGNEESNNHIIIKGGNEKYITGNNCAKSHNILLIKVVEAKKNYDNTDKYKNVIILPLFNEIKKLNDPRMQLNKMNINNSIIFANKKLKEVYSNFNKYIVNHQKQYILTKDNKYNIIDNKIDYEKIKSKCSFKIGKSENIINNIKELLNELNEIDNTILFLNICEEFNKIKKIKKTTEANEYIDIINTNIESLQSHGNIYIRKTYKIDIYNLCNDIINKKNKIQNLLTNFINKNKKDVEFSKIIDNIEEIFKEIETNLIYNEQLIPEINRLENEFIDLSKLILKLCDNITFFIKPGQTLTCIKHCIKIINTIFYIDIISVINNTKLKNKNITEKLSIIKQNYPAYCIQLYKNNNITKDNINNIINLYV